MVVSSTFYDNDNWRGVQTTPDDHRGVVTTNGKGTGEGTAATADVGVLVHLLLKDCWAREEELARE